MIEIGGGTGWQARILADHGYRVDSVDIHHPAGDRFFPVQLYDGSRTSISRHMHFDIVFSSNVLEHVTELDRLLPEMTRILKPGGKMIHVLPTHRLANMDFPDALPFPVEICRKRWKCNDDHTGPPHRTRNTATSRLAWHVTQCSHSTATWHQPFVIFRTFRLFCTADGNKPSHNAGLDVVSYQECELFYTGHSLLPKMGIHGRQRIALFLGSSSLCMNFRHATLPCPPDEDPARNHRHGLRRSGSDASQVAPGPRVQPFRRKSSASLAVAS